jgi:hypothetical protein
MWVPATEPGFEHLKLTVLPHRVTASGLIIGLVDNLPFRVHYEIGCDVEWGVRRVDVQQLDLPTERAVYLVSDGAGEWETADSEPLPAFDGCLDVDISATPFTNTIPIRRLNLQAGQSADLKVLYVSVPSMTLQLVQQQYTCLERYDTGGVYRYEGFPSGFTAQLIVDRDGIVIDYPDGWRRVLPEGGN